MAFHPPRHRQFTFAEMKRESDLRRAARVFYERVRKRLRGKGEELSSVLNFEDVAAKMLSSNGCCHRSGIDLIKRPPVGNKNSFTNPWQGSLDRIDSTRGYEADNVQVVCWAYNAAKGSWTDMDVLRLALGIVRKSHLDLDTIIREMSRSDDEPCVLDDPQPALRLPE
jgi:hypothetical protein